MNNKIKSILAVLVIISMIIPAMAVGNANSNKAQNAIGGVEVAPGVFYLGQAMDKGQIVEGYAFVHYAKDSDKVTKIKPVWDDSYDKYKFLLPSLKLKWANTMQYKVNPTSNGLGDAPYILSIIDTSLETWDIETADEIFASSVTDYTVSYSDVQDQTNTVTWGTLPWANAIAVNSLWINRYFETIVESDVAFSTSYTWADCTVTGSDCINGKMDLQNIATHEFGHNGLGDLYMPPSKALTMHGYGWFGDIGKRTLGDGDKLGIQALYGVRE